MVKGKRAPHSKKAVANGPLDAIQKISAHSKAPGQVGLHAPQSLDAIRRANPEQRKKSQSEPVFGGKAGFQVSPQTYDCYKPAHKGQTKSGRKK